MAMNAGLIGLEGWRDGKAFGGTAWTQSQETL